MANSVHLVCCVYLQILKASHFSIGHIGSMGRGKCHAEMSADGRWVAAGAADGQVRGWRDGVMFTVCAYFSVPLLADRMLALFMVNMSAVSWVAWLELALHFLHCHSCIRHCSCARTFLPARHLLHGRLHSSGLLTSIELNSRC